MGITPERVTRHQVRLGLVRPEDLPLLFAWRSDREIMRFLPSAPKKPSWEEHCDWYYHQGSTTFYRMIWLGDSRNSERPVGVLHLSADGEVGILVGEKGLWGRGLGKVALAKFVEEIQSNRQFPLYLWAAIHPENLRSRRLFEGLNFRWSRSEEARNGQLKYVWRGDST